MATDYSKLSDPEKLEVNKRNWHATADRFSRALADFDLDEAFDAHDLSNILLDAHNSLAAELGSVALTD